MIADQITPSPGGVRVDHATTSGTFSLDGGTWEVENNVWVVGDDTECVVIDAPHDAGRHAPPSITTTERSTSPWCILSKAASTSAMPIRSLTNASRSKRPCR